MEAADELGHLEQLLKQQVVQVDRLLAQYLEGRFVRVQLRQAVFVLPVVENSRLLQQLLAGLLATQHSREEGQLADLLFRLLIGYALDLYVVVFEQLLDSQPQALDIVGPLKLKLVLIVDHPGHFLLGLDQAQHDSAAPVGDTTEVDFAMADALVVQFLECQEHRQHHVQHAFKAADGGLEFAQQRRVFFQYEVRAEVVEGVGQDPDQVGLVLVEVAGLLDQPFFFSGGGLENVDQKVA